MQKTKRQNSEGAVLMLYKKTYDVHDGFSGFRVLNQGTV
jgi:hypothetical protein